MSEPCTCPSHGEPGDAWICPAHGHRYVLVPYYEVRYVDRHGNPMPPPAAPDHGKPEGTTNPWWQRLLSRIRT